MKLKDICLSAMFLVVAQPALAAETSKKPVTHWTCADFLSIDDELTTRSASEDEEGDDGSLGGYFSNN